MKTLSALLINPYIYDFAAYNFWSSPLGLLYIGSILRDNGFDIKLIDCMEVQEEKRKEDGRAPFVKEKVAQPALLKGIKKHFKRYGISPQELKKRLLDNDEPDIILVTSIMTYWYPGTEDVVKLAREVFPGAKIVVGGIYPTLCDNLAADTLKEADLIVKSNEIEKFYSFIEDTFLVSLSKKHLLDDLDALPFPCYDLYESIAFVPLLTSFGCAFKCTYCATPYMHPAMIRRSPSSVVDEISHWYRRGVNKYVIYDDSFLYKKEVFAKPLLKTIRELPFTIEDIYNPNAINAAFVDEELAMLLASTGFREVRIGLESIDPEAQKSMGGKVNLKNFERALLFLKKAGFNNNVYIYILAGLPFQKWEEVKDAIDYIVGLGAKPYIAEYTPIPHTAMFEQFYHHARYPILENAIYQNNALFPFAWEGFTEENLTFLKNYARTVKT